MAAARAMPRSCAWRSCLGASQFAAVALQTLWIATWLRDVAGYTPAEVARGLLAVNASMIAGYLVFGRAADALQRRGRSALPLLARRRRALVAMPRAADPRRAHACSCGACSSPRAPRWCSAIPILSRRYPKAMAGRANTAINVFGFVGMFAGQWGIGLVLDLWPPTRAAATRPKATPGRSAWPGRCSSPASPGCGAAARCWRRALLRPRLEVDVAVRGVDRGRDHRPEHQPAEAERQRGDDREHEEAPRRRPGTARCSSGSRRSSPSSPRSRPPRGTPPAAGANQTAITTGSSSARMISTRAAARDAGHAPPSASGSPPHHGEHARAQAEADHQPMTSERDAGRARPRRAACRGAAEAGEQMRELELAALVERAAADHRRRRRTPARTAW